MDRIIVSRHPAAIEFIARHMGGEVVAQGTEFQRVRWVTDPCPDADGHVETDSAYIISHATAKDVDGKHVYGNLPLHLAALAARVTVIEFTGPAPRGAEYSLADMDAAGAVLRSYVVTTQPVNVEDCPQCRAGYALCEAHAGGR